MVTRKRGSLTPLVAGAILLLGFGCGGGSDSSSSAPADPPPAQPDPGPDSPAPEPSDPQPPAPPEPPAPEPEEPEACGEPNEYESTWEGIYEQIFVARSCNEQVCHGAAGGVGGLDLRSEVAWDNIHEIRSTSSTLDLIEPGDNDASYLWLKVAAGTNPGSVEISGGAMPTGSDPLSEDELELLRLWIKGGAPEEGTVSGTEVLLEACLPEPEPLVIKPLQAPDPEVGIQFVMPSWPLPAATEREVCFATYFDVRDEVPPEFLSEDGDTFFISGYDLRQDAQSHHLIIMGYEGPHDVDHPSFGQWTCLGGAEDGASCDPKENGVCGEGTCISQIRDLPGCTGFGPPGGPSPLSSNQILVVQQSAETRYLPEGAYDEVPSHGIVYYNSHAFNLTSQDFRLNGRVNWFYATDRTHRVYEIFAADRILSVSVPAYEKRTICSSWTAPRGARVFNLLSHYHERGERFWIMDPDGEMIYENFVYNDPLNLYLEPPMALDSPLAEERTFEFCATYNNGVKPNGDPDPSVVKRFSELPQNTFFIGGCTASHCWSGRVGEECDGYTDSAHATCDQSPGSGDGLCDACTVSGGVTTEDEMFLILGSYWVEPVAD